MEWNTLLNLLDFRLQVLTQWKIIMIILRKLTIENVKKLKIQ
jgi:hypothetical protein